jgi:hypothetical protein
VRVVPAFAVVFLSAVSADANALGVADRTFVASYANGGIVTPLTPF